MPVFMIDFEIYLTCDDQIHVQVHWIGFDLMRLINDIYDEMKRTYGKVH